MELLVTVLLAVGALGLAVQALIGLSFFVSCIWEKERRASVFAGLQFLGMCALLVIYLLLIWNGFFRTTLGLAILIAGYVLDVSGAILLLRRTAPNPRALQGSKGLIVGEVKRQDERTHVFARNRSLRPGSEQYEAFYKQYPEYEEYDKRRRQLGGPLGHPGVIDKPHEGPNVAATLASASIPVAFPPVMIEAEANGKLYDEMHVDGGAASQVFLYPLGIDWARVEDKLAVIGSPNVYMIRNSQLDSKWKTITRKLAPIAMRSVDSLIRTQGLGDMYRIYLGSMRDGLEYHLAYIPDDFNEESEEFFDPVYMRKLFDHGYNKAKLGYPWKREPPGMDSFKQIQPAHK